MFPVMLRRERQRIMVGTPTLQDRYEEVRRRVAEAATASGRRHGDVIIVAVTKYAEVEQIRELMELGHLDFGENRVQQLVQRAAIISEQMDRRRMLSRAEPGPDAADPASAAPRDHPVRWHMVGHLQRNKVRKVLDCARLIHSVDSLRLAEEIQQVAFKRDQAVEVLVQVNCSGEKSKFGCAASAALHLCEQIDTMIHVRVRGLMTMAPYSDRAEDARPTFVRCRELYEEIRGAGIGEGRFNLLSMGMTDDFEVALSEGANVVRIGRAIFGEHEPEG